MTLPRQTLVTIIIILITILQHITAYIEEIPKLVKKDSASGRKYDHKSQPEQTPPKHQRFLQNNSTNDSNSDQHEGLYQPQQGKKHKK